MAKTFEELDVYKLSCEVNNDVWELRNSIKHESPGTWYQLDRSAGSISDNIAEGFGRETRPDFKNFLRYSKGSAMEAHSQISRCSARGLIDEKAAKSLIQKLRRITAMLTSFQKYLAQERTHPGQASEPSGTYRSVNGTEPHSQLPSWW